MVNPVDVTISSFTYFILPNINDDLIRNIPVDVTISSFTYFILPNINDDLIRKASRACYQLLVFPCLVLVFPTNEVSVLNNVLYGDLTGVFLVVGIDGLL